MSCVCIQTGSQLLSMERDRQKGLVFIVFVWPQAGDRETFAAVEANRCFVRETTYLLREYNLVLPAARVIFPRTKNEDPNQISSRRNALATTKTKDEARDACCCLLCCKQSNRIGSRRQTSIFISYIS